MLYTTLNNIHQRCDLSAYCWHGLLDHLNKSGADDDRLSFATILEANGLYAAVQCLGSVDGHDREIQLFAVACARRIEHLDTSGHAKQINDVSRRFAIGLATRDELATVVRGATHTYTRPSNATAQAAREAAFDAAAGAACAASMDAAAGAAWWAMGEVLREAIAKKDMLCAATWDDAWGAAWHAARDAQKADFIAMFCTDDNMHAG